MADNYFDFIGQNAGEEKKEVPQETQAMANVTVRADADCFLLCDGEYLDIQLDAGKMTKIQVPIGQHLMEFIYTEDANIKVEKVVDFPEAGKNYLVLVQDLKAAADNVAAAAKAEEEGGMALKLIRRGEVPLQEGDGLMGLTHAGVADLSVQVTPVGVVHVVSHEIIDLLGR